MRVEVVAKFASMPTRTSVHTRTVNSAPGGWDAIHPIRYVWETKGLFMRSPGHMAHNRARDPRVGTRTQLVASFPVQAVRPRLHVKVYGDLNTFRAALVPQSE